MKRTGQLLLACVATVSVTACAPPDGPETTAERQVAHPETGPRYGRTGPPKPGLRAPRQDKVPETTTTTVPAGPESEPADGRPVVYLTFDDGPVPAYTNPILDTLAERDVQATFFVLGQLVERHPDIVARMAGTGHSVQNHTYNHLDAAKSTSERFGFDVYATSVSIERHAGTAPNCIRPPYGSRPDLVQQWTGLPTVMWDIDPKDWKKGTPTDRIVRHVVTNVSDGAVVLLHDGGGDRSATAAAVGPIIDTLHAAGYRFATLCT